MRECSRTTMSHYPSLSKPYPLLSEPRHSAQKTKGRLLDVQNVSALTAKDKALTAKDNKLMQCGRYNNANVAEIPVEAVCENFLLDVTDVASLSAPALRIIGGNFEVKVSTTAAHSFSILFFFAQARLIGLLFEMTFLLRRQRDIDYFTTGGKNTFSQQNRTSIVIIVYDTSLKVRSQ
eukprot:g39094.t1